MKSYHFVLLFLLLTVYNNSFSESKHLQELLKKYPYGILGDDFEVLNMDDLAINACATLEQTPFEQRSNWAYPYWQCFETKSSRLICNGYEYDESEKTFFTILVVSGIKDGIKNEYLSRRVIPFSHCKSFRDNWRRFTKNEKYICISGMHMRESTQKNGDKIAIWTFDKFKTKKGCDSYFDTCSKKICTEKKFLGGLNK